MDLPFSFSSSWNHENKMVLSSVNPMADFNSSCEWFPKLVIFRSDSWWFASIFDALEILIAYSPIRFAYKNSVELILAFSRFNGCSMYPFWTLEISPNHLTQRAASNPLKPFKPRYFGNFFTTFKIDSISSAVSELNPFMFFKKGITSISLPLLFNWSESKQKHDLSPLIASFFSCKSF